MSDESTIPQPTDPTEDTEWAAINKKFDESTRLGDQAFLYTSWSAWSILAEKKQIAPVVRIAFGDLSGNIIFDRSVVITAIADLLNELSYTFLDQVIQANEMEGYSFDIPGDPKTMLKNLENANKRISAALELVNKTKFVDASGSATEDN